MDKLEFTDDWVEWLYHNSQQNWGIKINQYFLTPFIFQPWSKCGNLVKVNSQFPWLDKIVFVGGEDQVKEWEGTILY